MSPMMAIIGAFSALRQRGVRDPLYARLVEDGGTKGWLWRDPRNMSRDLHTGERFTMTIDGKPDTEVVITWEPILFAKVEGDPADVRRALWFLHQGPRVSGGTHQTIDNFECGPADWDLTANDFFLVRCGSYQDASGKRRWRNPSDDALGWIRDPGRFLVGDRIRHRVLDAVSRPLPGGERLTIRRVFNN